VYASRPLACHVDRYYEERLREQVDAKVYYAMQAFSCMQLDPGNAAMPALAWQAWCAAGHDDSPLVLAPEQMASAITQITQTVHPGDLELAGATPAMPEPM
jgi:hypothetical protein